MGGEFECRACAASATCNAQVATGMSSPIHFAKIGDGEGSSSLQEPDFASSAVSTADSPDAARSGRRRGACEVKAEKGTGKIMVFTLIMGTRVQVIAFSYEGRDQACDKVCQSEFLGNRHDMEHSIISVKAANEQNTLWRHFKSAEVAFLALKHWQRAGELENIASEEALQVQQTGLGPEDPTYAGHGSAWAAMFSILRQKFRPGSEMAQRLLSTNEAFLLCRCSRTGVDQVWSDNASGDGANWLGMQLMLIRDELRNRDGRWSNAIRLGVDVETGRAHSSIAAATWRQATTVASEGLQYAEAKLILPD